MSTTSAASSSRGSSGAATGKLSEQQAMQQLQARRSEMQGIAQKIGELESDADEHKLVIDTLREAQKSNPDRKCFRLIGGVLVERTVKEVLPALESNMAQLRQIMETLVKQYKQKDQDLQTLAREYGAVPVGSA